METRRALWKPYWYDLDQPLTVHSEGVLLFHSPTPATALERGFALQFYSGLLYRDEFEVRVCTIASMEHPQLGEVQAVKTGLDYEFEFAGGIHVKVDAEGESGGPPGPVQSNVEIPHPTTWELIVNIAVGPPLPDHPFASGGDASLAPPTSKVQNVRR